MTDYSTIGGANQKRLFLKELQRVRVERVRVKEFTSFKNDRDED